VSTPRTNDETSNYTARFNVAMLPEERAMLQALAEDNRIERVGRPAAMIRHDCAARFGKKKPGEPAPKYNSAALRASKKARIKR